MKVMILMKATSPIAIRNYETAQPPTEEAIMAMHEFNEQLHKAGVLLDLGGLTPSARGARIKYSGGKRTVTDGPFTEAKELIAGYSVLEVKSLAEAVEWAKRSPVVGMREGEELEVEIRPLYDASDFDPGKGV